MRAFAITSATVLFYLALIAAGAADYVKGGKVVREDLDTRYYLFVCKKKRDIRIPGSNKSCRVVEVSKRKFIKKMRALRDRYS